MWLYLMIYTAGRGWIEMLRIDEAETILGLRLNVWTSVVVFLVGAVGLAITSQRPLSDAIERSGEGPEEGSSEEDSSEEASADQPSEDASPPETDAETRASHTGA